MEDENELPTVVIDSSMDDKEIAQQYRQINDCNSNGEDNYDYNNNNNYYGGSGLYMSPDMIQI